MNDKKRRNHGLSKTSLYKKWARMKTRCNNKNCKDYKWYGGRGIEMCQEWADDFTNFYNWATKTGYKEGLTIDRINGRKGYNPENCRWMDMSQQQSNRNTVFWRDYTGVYFRSDKKSLKYRAIVTYRYKKLFDKHFKTAEEAIQARNKFITENKLPHKIQ